MKTTSCPSPLFSTYCFASGGQPSCISRVCGMRTFPPPREPSCTSRRMKLRPSRADVRIARGLRLRSLRLGLTGMADVVEFHRLTQGAQAKGVHLEGVDGLWQPFIVEYKRGRLRHEEGYEIQLCAQALCLEEVLHVQIDSGSLFYGKTRRRLDIAFSKDLRSRTEAAAARLHELLGLNITPKAASGPKCEQCSLVDLCLPKVTGTKRIVEKYLAEAINDKE